MSEFIKTPIGTLPADWSYKEIGPFVDMITGPAFDSTRFSDDPVGVRLARGINITKGHFRWFPEITKYWTKITPDIEKYLLCEGDVIIGMDGSLVGRNYALADSDDVPSLLVQRVARLRTDNCLDCRFLYYFIASDFWLSYVDIVKTHSGIPHISNGDIREFRIAFPPPPQQRKIARILTTVDNLIEKTEALIAKYQAIKQGMMHDLFTRGVDEHGHLRPPYEEAPELYKESELGWIPKEWEVENLQDAVDFWDGKRIPLKQEDRDLMDGEFPYYGASGIIDYVDRFLFDDELILLGEDGENVVSRNLPLAFRVSGKCWVNNHAHVLKPLGGIDIDFLAEYLESLDYSGIASGSAQPKITQKHLARTKVKLPSIDEQRSITSQLSTLVAKLRIEEELAAKYRLHKTGLMQDLLTGKVRVDEEKSIKDDVNV